MLDEPRKQESLAAQDAVWKTGRKRGRSRWRKNLSRNVGYVGIRVLYAVVSRLPWKVGRVLAWIAGSGAYCILKRERDIATQSLTRVFGAEKTPAQIQQLVRRVFRHTASVIIDWVILRRWRREKLERAFPNVVASVRAAEAEIKSLGTGVIAITAHCGNWEMLALFFSRFAPGLLATVAKRLYFEKYNAFLHRLRTEQGFDPIYSDESPRKMIRAVQDRKMLGFLCDQDLRTNSGVFVDFFGLPAYTVTFPIEIARKMGVKMIFCVLVREGRGFRVVYRPPFDPPNSSDKTADILAGTQLWTNILEETIRQYPEQWSWVHPRWRTTPDRPRRQLDSKLKKGRER